MKQTEAHRELRDVAWRAHRRLGTSLLAAVAGGVLAGAVAGAAPEADARGSTLYSRHCASCHGASGRGDGPAAYLLQPKPRDFTRVEFRLISTDNGVPSDGDLLAAITRGMPGSAMPPWAHLPEADRKALVRQVQRLAYEGAVADLERDGSERAEAEEIAGERLAVGGPVELPAPVPDTAATRARGAEVYARSCQSCHGADGRGKGVSTMRDSEGRPIYARDFTAGIFKGGSSEEQILTRLVAGMPGTPMPTFLGQVSPEELRPLVHHVRSLVPEGAQTRVEQHQEVLHAGRAAEAMPEDPMDPAWASIPAVRLSLMPLWWRDQRIEGIEVRARHDGKRLALHLSWLDATEDGHIAQQDAFGDGAAVQVSPDPEPPFLGMGDASGGVEIWHWKAHWEADRSGFRDVDMAHPNMAWDLYPEVKRPPFGNQVEVASVRATDHQPGFLTGWGAKNPISDPAPAASVETAYAKGFGTLARRPASATRAGGKGAWKDGRWQVVVGRALAAEGGSVPLTPGREVQVGFAAWDGSSGDRNGQKSVTIWHRLVIE